MIGSGQATAAREIRYDVRQVDRDFESTMPGVWRDSSVRRSLPVFLVDCTDLPDLPGPVDF